jgi:hypothetical protein
LVAIQFVGGNNSAYVSWPYKLRHAHSADFVFRVYSQRERQQLSAFNMVFPITVIAFAPENPLPVLTELVLIDV